jgi:hypothetical protein
MQIASILLIFLLFAPKSYAAFKLKPGLWEVQTKPKTKLPMKSANNGMMVCYSEKSFTDEYLTANPKGNRKCTMTEKKDLSDGVQFYVKCDKGTKSVSEYRSGSENTYTGWNEIENANGKERIEFSGKFVSENCGDLKPL